MRGGHRAGGIRGPVIIIIKYKFKPKAVVIFKIYHRFTFKSLLWLFISHLKLFEAGQPIVDRTIRHRKCSCVQHTFSMTALYKPFVREKCQYAARVAGFVAIIEMIHFRRIEVDRFFYQPEA